MGAGGAVGGVVTDWILAVLLLIVTANYVVERIEHHR